MLTGNLARLRCQAMRPHAFEPFAPVGKMHSWREVVCLKCIYCEAERYDTLNLYGEVLARRYVYPNGKPKRFDSVAEARVAFYNDYEGM